MVVTKNRKTLLFIIIFVSIFIINSISIRPATVTFNFNDTYQSINMWFYTTIDDGIGSYCTAIPPSNGAVPTSCGSLVDRSSNSALDTDDASAYTSTSDGADYAMHLNIARINITTSSILSMNWT